VRRSALRRRRVRRVATPARGVRDAGASPVRVRRRNARGARTTCESAGPAHSDCR
jgi:hypothetical protein